MLRLKNWITWDSSLRVQWSEWMKPQCDPPTSEMFPWLKSLCCRQWKAKPSEGAATAPIRMVTWDAKETNCPNCNVSICCARSVSRESLPASAWSWRVVVTWPNCCRICQVVVKGRSWLNIVDTKSLTAAAWLPPVDRFALPLAHDPSNHWGRCYRCWFTGTGITLLHISSALIAQFSWPPSQKKLSLISKISNIIQSTTRITDFLVVDKLSVILVKQPKIR